MYATLGVASPSGESGFCPRPRGGLPLLFTIGPPDASPLAGMLVLRNVPPSLAYRIVPRFPPPLHWPLA